MKKYTIVPFYFVLLLFKLLNTYKNLKLKAKGTFVLCTFVSRSTKHV